MSVNYNEISITYDSVRSENKGVVDLFIKELELVRNKGFSMFHLISDDEYLSGLKQLEADALSGNLNTKNSGETLVWFKKK